ncbi:MAG TPA: hypothetical protein VGF40_02230 [Thermoanaerobaculia bacterium]
MSWDNLLRFRLHLTAVIGLAALAIYLNAVLGWIALSERLELALVFGIGPAIVVATLAIGERLNRRLNSMLVRAGTLFMVIGFAIFTLMLTMQQALFAEYARLRALAATDEARLALRESFLLADQAQLGADVAFDVFAALGIILVSIALFRVGRFASVVGAYGLATAGGLLALNLWFFPVPPAEAGSIDLGPLTSLWFIGLISVDRRLKGLEAAGRLGAVRVSAEATAAASVAS